MFLLNYHLEEKRQRQYTEDREKYLNEKDSGSLWEKGSVKIVSLFRSWVLNLICIAKSARRDGSQSDCFFSSALCHSKPRSRCF
jgi:hypothetical protein